MNIDDLPKNRQLLIFMMNRINSCNESFTVADDGYDVVAFGITKNAKSLSSMLQSLANKGLIEQGGHANWFLTDLGETEATYWQKKCDEDDEDDDEDGTMDVFATSKIDSLSILHKLEDAAVKLAVCKVDVDKSNCTAASLAIQAAINAVQAANAIVESLDEQD